MNIKYRKMLALSAIVAVGMTTAVAKDGSRSTASQSSKANSEVRLSKLMDANVVSNAGENLGQLEDLIIDPQTGAVRFAVLGRGGVLGIGEKYVPVPWKAIQLQSEKQFTLNVDKNKLKSAPTTDKPYSNLEDPGYTVTIYRFFAVPADAAMGAAGDIEGSQNGAGSSRELNRTESNSSNSSQQESTK